MGKCIKCNKEMDGKFCVYCGEKLLSEADAENIKEKMEKEKLEEVLNTIKKEENENVNKTIKMNNKHENKQKDLIFVIIVFVIIIIAIIGFGLTKQKEYEGEIERLETQIEALNEAYRELDEEKSGDLAEQIINSNKAEFLDENIVFVLDGYGDYYYTYEQMREVTQGKDYTFWAYNTENAKYLGYRAWK